MPANPERRTQILDAAVDILADIGVGGVTHRQVDARAGLPPGTTSNYFRTGWRCSKRHPTLPTCTGSASPSCSRSSASRRAGMASRR